MKNFALGGNLYATLGLIAASVNAAPITFNGIDVAANSTDPRPNSSSSAASFDAAAGALGTVHIIDFESAPLGNFVTLAVAPGVTLSSNQEIRNTPQGTPDGLYGYNTTAGGSRFLSLFGGNITFNFSTPIQAFGSYLSGVQLTGETITFSDGSSQTLAIPNPPTGVEFFGFTDVNQSIASVTVNVQIGSTGDIMGIDDVRFVTVPEPASLSFVGLGFCAVALHFRRRFGRAS